MTQPPQEPYGGQPHQPYGSQPPAPESQAPQTPPGAPQGQYGAPQGQYSAPQPQYGAPQGQQGYQQPAQAPLSPQDSMQWGSLAHLLGILWILPSLIIWLVYKDRDAFVEYQSRKALNFQIIALIGAVALGVLQNIPFIGWIFWIAWIALWVGVIVFSILAYNATKQGQDYKYPISFEIVKAPTR